MTMPMDVLKDAAARLPKSRWDDGQRALAVMAELIEAANAWCDLMPGLEGGPEFDRLTNALAYAGGAK